MSTALAIRGLQYGYLAHKGYRKYGPQLRKAQKVYTTAKKYAPIATKIYQKGAEYYKKKGKIFSRQSLGKEPGISDSKRNTGVANDTRNLDTRTLYSYDGISLTSGTSGGAASRLRNTIFVSGFKICAMIKNNNPAPLCVNMAVVYSRQSNIVSTSDFFRGLDDSSRGTNFSDALTANERHTLPINTDQYRVLYHKRFYLSSANDAAIYEDYTSKNFRIVKKWIPINRNIMFESLTDAVPKQRVFVVWWTDRFMEPAGTVPVADAWDLQQRIVTYFREPQCC